MGLIPEGLRYVVQNIFHTKKKPLPIRILLRILPDVFTEQIALQTSIKEKAHMIAENVRTRGEQKFGPQWAQGYSVLPNGRIVFLQQSQGGAQVDEVLEINIPPAPNDPCSIHVRYDLRRGEINTYEIRQENNEPITAYWIHDRPDLKTRVPTNLTLSNIVKPVEKIFQSVAIASNTIMWKEPKPTSVIY